MAYSYVRFSTGGQRLGSSEGRQLGAAEKWAAGQEPRLEIDKSHIDRGVSGFKLRNVKAGALGLFLGKIKSGEILPGSILIVESLNRLTRSEPLDAFDLLREIIKAGVEVVTLHDGQRYTGASMREIGPLIQALVLMSGAHRESENKSFWLAKAWAEKRKEASTGRPLTRQVPAWLEVVGVRQNGIRYDWSAARFEVIKERSDLVVAMFEHRARGWGYRRIAAWLNEEGVAVWGRGKRKAGGGWQESYVHKLLLSRAVLGEYQPHKLEDGRYSRRIPVGEPIPDFYPRIVSDELWHASRPHLVTNRTTKGRPSDALFTGLVVDPDGAPMHMERKGSGCDYLATARAFRRKRKPVHRWRLQHLEKAIFQGICVLIDWKRVLTDQTREPEIRKLRALLGNLSEEEAAIKKKVARVAKALVDDLGDVGIELKKQADELTERRAAIASERMEIERKLQDIEGQPVSAGGLLDSLHEGLKKDLDDPEFRLKIARELRRVVKKIQLWPTGDVPGAYKRFLEDIRNDAAKKLKGNRGLSAKASGNVVGAIAITLANGRTLTFWVNYRVGARVDGDPTSFHALPQDWAYLSHAMGTLMRPPGARPDSNAKAGHVSA